MNLFPNTILPKPKAPTAANLAQPTLFGQSFAASARNTGTGAASAGKDQVSFASKPMLRFGNSSYAIDSAQYTPELAKTFLSAFELSRTYSVMTNEVLLRELLYNPATANQTRRYLVQRFQINPANLEATLTNVVNRLPRADVNTQQIKSPAPAKDFKAVIEIAQRFANQGETTSRISVPMLLEAMAAAPRGTAVRTLLEQASPLPSLEPPNPDEEEQSVLDAFTRDRTQEQLIEDKPPVIGRAEELMKVLTILGKNFKPNPILVGPAGVGKTAIVEKLAKMLATNFKDMGGIIPEALRQTTEENGVETPIEVLSGYDNQGKPIKQYVGKRLLEVDWPAIFAEGPEAKKIMKALVEEAKQRKGEVLLFVDEIHKLNDPNPLTNLANELKRELARGEVQFIGATTEDEYRRFIESDKALQRRFDKVIVDEPTLEQALTIARGVSEYLSRKHGVTILDEALPTLVKKCSIYLQTFNLPDSCLDILDRACATVALQKANGPLENIRLNGLIDQLRVDIKGLKNRSTQLSASRKAIADTLDKVLANLLNDVKALKPKTSPNDPQAAIITRFVNGAYNVNAISTVLQKLVENEGDASKLHPSDQTIVSLMEAKLGAQWKSCLRMKTQVVEIEAKQALAQAEIEEKDARVKELGEQRLTDMTVSPVVGLNEVLQAIAAKTGVPLEKLGEDERAKLLNLEEVLGKNLIGQKPAVNAVASAVRDQRMSDPDKPASFLFLGPTGTGKTEMAKVLAEEIYGDRDALIRVDMNDYKESHRVSTLLGSPPGYVGSDKGSKFIEAIKKKPYGVILFDELEKAHPDVFNIFLPMLDEGRITSAEGETFSLKNFTIIMTSNQGSRQLTRLYEEHGVPQDPDSKAFDRYYKDARRAAMQELNSNPNFKPEFLNRFHGIVTYHHTTPKDLRQIAALKIKKLNKELGEGDPSIQIRLSDAAYDFLVEHGYDYLNGARPLDRLISKIVKSNVTKRKLMGEYRQNQTVEISREMLEQWLADSPMENS